MTEILNNVTIITLLFFYHPVKQKHLFVVA